jgi:pimeloyl-ACP methyl ester carboxylesterase
MSAEKLEAQPIEVEGRLRGETLGEGPPIFLLHGITATRRQVVHGSNVLAREGLQMIQYDARGHGESEPAPDGTGYGSPQNVTDLRLVIEEGVGDREFVLAGHSMGSHTVIAHALDRPEKVAGLVVIGPAYGGVIADPEERQRALARWDELADGLEQGGVDGFLEVLERQGLDPGWRDTILRFTRERMEAHRHPEAVAQAMREVPRSKHFELDELEFLDLPALVVASHDLADPGHPYALAEAYAARLPRSRLISEEEGESPLAWQGGRLSREIAAFCAEPAVAERLQSAA